MKTIHISPRSKKLNALLKRAQSTDLILQAADGEQYLLTRIANVQEFEVGASTDFAEEIALTRQNERLLQFLSERAAKAKAQAGMPLAEVKKTLGLEE